MVDLGVEAPGLGRSSVPVVPAQVGPDGGVLVGMARIVGAIQGERAERLSSDATDLFYAHIGGLDTLAMALLAAADLVERGELTANKDARYAGWDGPLGAEILGGGLGRDDLEARVASGAISTVRVSGGQERLENVVNRSIWSAGRKG